MKRSKIALFAILSVLSIGMVAGATTIFDVSTNDGFNDWINTSDNVTVENDAIVFNSSTTGNVVFDHFEVKSHDNVTVETNATDSATLYVRGINESDGSVVESTNYTLQDGSNTFNTTNLSGDYTELEFEKTNATSELDVTRVAYEGELPDDGTYVVGGSTEGTIFGYDTNLWALGILAGIGVLFALSG